MLLPSPLAFSPGSVTCFFSPELNPSPVETKSTGFAINLDHGVTAAIRHASSNRTILNGKVVEIAPVTDVLRTLAPEPIELIFETALPIGCGFGVSAACTLTAAFGISKFFEIPKSRIELGLLAHSAEVVNRTGYGDVASQLCGGFVYRKCLLGPLDSVRLSFPPQRLFYKVFGKLATSTTLSSAPLLERITEEGRRATEWMSKHMNNITLDDLFDRSMEFADTTGLLAISNLATTIQKIRAAGGKATMIMLGQSIVSTRPLNSNSEEWVACEVDLNGTRWL
jgi:pantoate kinase